MSLIRAYREDFFRKLISVHCTFIRDLRVGCRKFAYFIVMKYHGFIILTRSVCWEDQNKLKHFRSSVFFSWCCTMFSLKANDRMYIMILYVFLEWEKKSLVEQTKMLWKSYVRISFVCNKLVRYWIPDRQKYGFLDGCAWFFWRTHFLTFQY